jgi:RHS repeat-associated protein
MRLVGRFAMWCLLFCGGLASWAAGVSQAASSTEGGGVSLLSAPFVTSASPEQAGEVQAEREAKLAAPEAVAERLASRKQYEGLHGEEAVALAKQVFSIEHPSWTAPDSAGEGRITKYLGENTATEVSASGKHLLLESTVPLRSAVGSGQLAPTSLTLEEREGAFVPANPVVPVSIAKTPAGGMSLPLGISIAPVQAAAPEGPVTAGDRVVFPGTATDTDFMVEPIPAGVETSWQLLGEGSPQENALRFSLPAGASLQLSKTSTGGAEVVREGQTLVSIRPASAVEASGTALPVSYSIVGDTLTTHVDLEGSVAFPVMVDPVIEGDYGAYGAKTWPGWASNDNCGTSCYGFFANENELNAIIAPASWPGGYAGEWIIYAPGVDEPGGAGVTRADIEGLTHNSEQSWMWAEIGDSNGEEGWTFNSGKGIEGHGTYESTSVLTNRAMAFCADNAGGADWTENPLCNENYSGRYFDFGNGVLGYTSVYNYTLITGAVVRYLDTTPPNAVMLEGIPSGGWVKHGPSEAHITANDQGTGIAVERVETPPGYENSKKEVYFLQEFGCNGANGLAGCQHSRTSSNISFAELPTGVHELGVYAYDAVGNVREDEVGESGAEQQGSGKRPVLYVDRTPPVIPAFGGPLTEDAAGGIGSGSYTLTFSAEDGSSATPQSGVRSLKVSVDGTKVDEVATSCPEPKGVPSSGCYALSASWSMEGARFGTGQHTVTVTATDWAGNEETRSLAVGVSEAPYEAVGPGSVNLKTGAFKLEATDATLAAAGADLAVGRTYNSRALTAGAKGPLGPQWSLSLPVSSADGEWQSLRAMTTGSVQATLASGELVTFTPTEKGFSPPAGYQSLTLSKISSSPLEYEITDASGNATIFQRASSSEEEAPLLVPSVVEQAAGAGGLNKVSYKFTTTAEGITEPTEMIAPSPAGVNCVAELVQGCRALEFKYDTATTATGEAQSQWGEYKGRLKEIKAVAWSTSETKMVSVPVADYLWDKGGRLRAVWDPQVSPALKTTYGYSEEQVTALTPPGQESWAISYGTIAGDSSSGRLLKVTRAAASASLWGGEVVANTTAPVVSGSATVGGSVSVSNGSWSGKPIAYSYQWELCNANGGECAVISGATNQTYTPLLANTGHTLVALVTATNGSGSTVKATTATSTVTDPVAFSSSFGSSGSGAGQLEGPAADALTATGELWVADAGNHRIEKYSGSGAFVEAVGWGVSNGKSELQTCTSSCKAGISGSEPGEFADPEGIVVNQSTGNIYVADHKDNRIQELSGSGTYLTSFGGYGSEPGKFNEVHGIALDSSGDVWGADTQNCRVEEFSSSGTFMKAIGSRGKGHLQFEGTFGVAFAGGKLYVTDFENQRVQEITPAGEWVAEFGKGGKGEGEFELPWAIATNPLTGNLYVSSWAGGEVEGFTPEGKFVEEFGHFGSEREEIEFPQGLAINSSGVIDVADEGNNRIDVWAPSSQLSQEPLQAAPGIAGSTTTVEYQIPLTGGGGAPPMTEAEVAKWGEKDTPVEATAIFPPDEPQSWPASNYRRATTFYTDKNEHTVNVATPGEAVTTAEYEGHGNTTRTLTADNRATALKEGSKSAEAAAPLYTENKYNGEGTQLESTIGPEHKVKLPNGSEVEARKQVKYSYEKEAPAGGPYHLVTESTEAALVSGKEEDVRKVSTNYSGQENLGWKLHQPTSRVVAPGGLNLTYKSVFNPATGSQTESVTPDATLQISEFPLPAESQPTAITVGPEKEMWFSDKGTGKIGKIAISTGAITEFAAEKHEPDGLVAGPEGDLRFVEHSAPHVSQMTPSGSLTSHTLSKNGSGNTAITVGSEEDFWFTEGESNYIVKMNTKSEVLGEFKLPSASRPSGITVGPEKDLWYADENSGYIGKITPAGVITETKLPAGSQPNSIVAGPEGYMWYSDYGTSKIGEMTTAGVVVAELSLPAGSKPMGITVGPEGYIWYVNSGTSKIGRIIPSSGAITEFALPAGSAPRGIAAGPNGRLWVTESGTSKIAEITPGTGEGHASQTIYYTPKTEASVAICQNHPEWANLPCEIKPTQQPDTPGLPALPVTTFTYNFWFEPELTKSTSGEGSEMATRTETDTFDAAGRSKSKEITSSTGTALPKVSYGYSTTTGLPTTETTGSGSSEQKLSKEYNARGTMIAYTDASGKTTTYEHQTEGDERLLKVADEKGNQAFGYSETTGAMTSLKDSGAGTFTASYDAEQNIVSETMPNGLTATVSRNTVGETVVLVYQKESRTWFWDDVVPSIHGQWMTQTGTIGTDNYAYNEPGWLTQVQETPAGKGCATRLYAYDADQNRTSVTKRPPASGGACATEGGEIESHAYDAADRLHDHGASYEPFGAITALPATDAGGAELQSGFYVDGQLAHQEQAGESIAYELDPARRTSETISTGKMTSSVVMQYDGPESTPAWLAYPSGEWTRNIFGISGSLAATQNDTETPTLQIANLHDDIIATVPDSETATKMSSAIEASEYGVPTVPEPPKYSWLGASALRTELPSGVVNMGARSYVPQLGRFLQPDPQPGGSANAYAYTHGDPLNESDPSGQWSLDETSGGLAAVGEGEGIHLENGVGIAAGAMMPAPVNLQIEEAFKADPPWDQITAGGEEYEEWEEYEEEGGYEYASDHQGGERGSKPEARLESGVLYQPLPEAAIGDGEAGSGNKSVAPLCEPGSGSSNHSCARDAMIMRGGIRGSCGCDIWVHGGKIAIRRGNHILLGAAEVTAGTLGAAASGFAFGACVVGGGEVDAAIHCVLGPGAAFTASVSVAVAGLKELF